MQAPVCSICETQPLRIALLLQLEELCEMTGGVYCFMAAVELPASTDSVDFLLAIHLCWLYSSSLVAT